MVRGRLSEPIATLVRSPRGSNLEKLATINGFMSSDSILREVLNSNKSGGDEVHVGHLHLGQCRSGGSPFGRVSRVENDQQH